MPPWIEGPIDALLLFLLLFSVGIVLAFLRPILGLILWTIIDIIRLFFYPILIVGGIVIYFVVKSHG